MSITDIILNTPDNSPREKVIATLKKYAKTKTSEQILQELPKKSVIKKKALIKRIKFRLKIKELNLEKIIFQLATGIEAKEQITMNGKNKIKGYIELTNLAMILSGNYMKWPDIGKYFRELAEKNNFPLLTKEHQKYINKFTVNYVIKSTKEQLKTEILQEGNYSLNHSNNNNAYFLRELSNKISKNQKLQFELFKKLTGINAQEQIKVTRPIGETPGYSILTHFAEFLTGKRKDVIQTGKYFRELARKNKMPLLDEKHQKYVNKFSTKYIKKKTKKELGKEMNLGKKYSITPGSDTYSPFLHELSKKIVNKPEFQMELFKKFTGIRKKEQITANGNEKNLGYSSVLSLMKLILGEKKEVKELGKYLRNLADKYL